MASGKSTLLKQKDVPGGYDRTRYQVQQIYATAFRRSEDSDLRGVPEGCKAGWKRGRFYLTGYGS